MIGPVSRPMLQISLIPTWKERYTAYPRGFDSLKGRSFQSHCTGIWFYATNESRLPRFERLAHEIDANNSWSDEMNAHLPFYLAFPKLMLIASTVFLGPLAAHDLQNPAGVNPREQENPILKALVPIEDVPGLPRVLLIGDSISMSYTLPVRELLEGKANVQHPPENCENTALGLKQLDSWLGTKKWDVIHFNFGLHDLKHQDEQGKNVSPDKGKPVVSLPAGTVPAPGIRRCRPIIGRLPFILTSAPTDSTGGSLYRPRKPTCSTRAKFHSP
jgi:hypothetical protein